MAINDKVVYELSINVRASWQAHSLSNVGNDGSIRTMPRHQLLADGTLTDACSGNIAKYHHARLLAEYFAENGTTLCPPCRTGDGRRAAALVDMDGYDKDLTIDRIVAGCGLCDAHGFLITAKAGARTGGADRRPRLSKHSLIEFSYALALPDRHEETIQLTTRSGVSGASKEEGQMLMKTSVRSGDYALCVRYRAVGIGADTDRWRLIVHDEAERLRRHRAILHALRDCLISPEGALTSATLPHITGLTGAVMVRNTAGRAPLYSPLADEFVSQLLALTTPSCAVYPFETMAGFHATMEGLIERSVPAIPAIRGDASESF